MLPFGVPGDFRFGNFGLGELESREMERGRLQGNFLPLGGQLGDVEILILRNIQNIFYILHFTLFCFLLFRLFIVSCSPDEKQAEKKIIGI